MFDIFKDKVIIVTGHTGFKGAWLCEWFLMLGAKVIGYSLEPPSDPSLYSQLNHNDRLDADYREDIRDRKTFAKINDKHQPDFIFHLAAQTLVGEGYKDPVYNYETNIMGTINVLDTLRVAKNNPVCIIVTTDKVYENKEWIYSYRENDEMGGYDPYSASKGCVDIITSSYMRSYFNAAYKNGEEITPVASVRAGNVIGGGDWALDRIVPDCIRSLSLRDSIPVRNKVSTRPWQHVLEPLSGYMMLASKLYELKANNCKAELLHCCSPFNFGPNISSNKTVEELVKIIIDSWGEGDWIDASNPNAVHEAGMLNLASDKAFHLVGWRSKWAFQKTIQMTVEWYKHHQEMVGNGNFSTDALIDITRNQIKDYAQSPFQA